MRRIYSYLILTFIVLISSLVLWKAVGFLTIYKHYDGPLYVVVAKTFYNPQAIKSLHLEMTSPSKYFAAHLPLYPILISAGRELILQAHLSTNGLEYLKSMVGINLLSTIGLVLFFYYLLKKFKLTKNPLILASVLLFLPRFLVVRSVGAPESLFMLLVLLSLFFFEKEKFWIAGLFGGLATMTKTPGILLFAGYGLVFIERIIKEKKFSWDWLGIILIPLGLLGVFKIYGMQYNDFFAYFHSGDNIHLSFPFSVFNFQKPWVGTAWLDEILFYYFIYGMTVLHLKNIKQRSFFYFSLVFFIATISVRHRDISRYSLPLWPLALIAFEKFFTSKKFLIVLIILLPAIFLYAWNLLLYNVMPISDWSAFL
jgi:Gpi18-like mannosyltransferase